MQHHLESTLAVVGACAVDGAAVSPGSNTVLELSGSCSHLSLMTPRGTVRLSVLGCVVL
jgi:hypothetical protein